jgi:hypothetical protein
VTEDKAQPLSATTFEPAPVIAESDKTATRGDSSRTVIVGGAIGIALLLFVFFILPEMVSPDAVDPASSAVAGNPTSEASGDSRSTTGAGTVNGEGRSPFAEAQESALRREAQEVLQALLSLQESLTARGAARWGEPLYSEALNQAAAGDTAYRERDFELATSAYQAALDQLSALETSLPERIESLHSSLIAAIEAGDVPAAQARFNNLAEMAPADIRLIALEDRLTALPEVITALASATQAEGAGNLDAAVDAASTATRADLAHERAQARLAELQAAQRRKQFTEAMTVGYAALASQSFNTAEAQFREAATLYPGAPEPAAALIEVEQARTQKTLMNFKDQGAQAERDERWADATSLYEQALEIDALLLFATEGLERSMPRAELDERLAKIPDERDRLVDARILRMAQNTLAEAEAIANPGPRLKAQRAAAQEALAYASTPVPVTMQSDGLTDITLLRVKRLGALSSQSLSLRPGRYTAVGMRKGFRDVRVQFEVRPDQANTVEVRCVETI